jgi:hypothetical protein
MPAINQPKLKELYNTTFFIPSSLVSTVIVPASNVAFTDGQGGVYYVGGIAMPVMYSTVKDLASGGYVSSTQLFSTIRDLASGGYVSSTQLFSTINDLGTGGYVSSTQLFSTVIGLGTAGYISTGSFDAVIHSTVQGLATAGYVSSTQQASTTSYFLVNYISTGQQLSTINALSQIGYVSSTQLISTTSYIVTNYVSTGQHLSTINALSQIGYVSSTQLFSTIRDLSKAGYVSSTQLASTATYFLVHYVSTGHLTSTVKDLSLVGYVSSTQLTSTMNGLSLVGYVSSTQLTSTINGLSIIGYVSSTQLTSTIQGLSIIGYVSSTQLTSTIQGLSLIGYVSSTQLQSTIRDLSLAGYVSSTQLTSTMNNLSLVGYVSSTQLNSTIRDLSQAGYVSSTQIVSTLNSITSSFTVRSLYTVTVSSSSTFIDTLSTGYTLAGVISTASLSVFNTAVMSTVVVTGNLSVRQSFQFNAPTVSTNQVETSTVKFRDTLAPNTTYNVYARGGNLAIDGDNIVVNSYLASQLASTTQGLASSRYVSSTQLTSTIQGLSIIGYVSSTQLQSTIRDLSRAGYVSSTQLESTIRDLSEAGYVSSSQLESTIQGLAWSGYVSSTQMTSTIRGLSIIGYVSSTQLNSTIRDLSRAGYVSSTQMTSTMNNLSLVGYVSSTQMTSTMNNLSLVGYVSSTQLTSTMNGLSLVGYVSSTQLSSTIRDLAMAGYVSSSQLTSTIANLGSGNFVSSPQLLSTVANLGSANYVSSTQLLSTVRGFTYGFVTSTLDVQSGVNMASTYTQFLSTNSFIGDSVVSMRVYGNQVNNISYSQDGVSWTNPVVNGFLTAGTSVTYGLGIWVATGTAAYAQGTIKYSVDRNNWIDSLTGGFDNGAGLFQGYSVRFNGTIFLAGGLSLLGGTTQRSTDGSNWTASVNGFANPVNSIAWCPNLGLGGTNVWVAVGNGNGIPNRSIQSSTDGSNWTAIGASSGLSIGYDITASATAIIAVGAPSSPANPTGNIVKSVGGAGLATWAPIGNPSLTSGQGVSYNAGAPASAQWVVVGQTYFGPLNTIYYAGGGSPTSFTAATSGGFTALIGNGVTWGNNKWVAVGAGSINGGTIQNSTDGRNWTSQLATPFEYYGSYVGNSISYNSPYYMAVGNGETQTTSSKATIIGPSSISTTHIDVGTLTANSVLVSGSNTLTVAGNSFLNGPTTVAGLLRTVAISTFGGLTVTGPVNINSNTLTVPTVSSRSISASTITLFDQTNNTNLGNVYYNRSLFYLNSNQILTDNAASGRLTLSTLFVTNTISTTNLFTSNISTSMINARFMSVRNIYVSTIGFGDIQYPWVVNRLYASSQMLYFNDINLTSSIVGNGCGTCISSNISFNSVDTQILSTASGFVDILSTGLHYATLTYAEGISTIMIDASTITLRDPQAGESFSLRSFNGNLIFNNSTIGIIPNVVNSNLVLTSLNATGSITAGNALNSLTATIPTVYTQQTQVSTLLLIDQNSPLSNYPFTARDGLFYFNNSNIVPLGNDMLFSTVGVQNNLVAGYFSTNYISSALADISTITANSINSKEVVLNDKFLYAAPNPIYNSNGTFYYGKMPVAVGGLTNASPYFSTLSVRQHISTTSTVTDALNVKLTTTTCNIFGFAAAFQTISTSRITTSNVIFMDRFGSNSLQTSNGALFYNNQAIQYGGTNAPGVSQMSTLISFSTITNTVSTNAMSVSSITGASAIGFRDAATGAINSMTTSNGILYIGQNQATGTVVVASNFTLSNLTVLDTISTSSTFTNFVSTANSFIDTLTVNIVTASKLNTAEINDGNSAFTDITVRNVNNLPYPIFNYGSNMTACCGSYAGYAQIGFTTAYTNIPAVTVTLSDVNNLLAIMNVVYIDQYGFTVGSFDINAGTARVISSVMFNYMAIGT